jgi:hypothetical protein
MFRTSLSFKKVSKLRKSEKISDRKNGTCAASQTRKLKV